MTTREEWNEQLASWITEASDLRFRRSAAVEGPPRLPPVESGPGEVLAALRDVRGRLDRVEEILLLTTSARSRSQASRVAAETIVDDNWATAVVKAKQGRSALGSDYSSAKERHAEADLAVLHLRRDARLAAELAASADAAVDMVRLCHRGLDSIRTDLNNMMRSYQFETRLER